MSSLSITDHALVRFFERTGAMDVEEMRELIAASLEKAAQAALAMETQRFLILADGLVYVVEERAVVTVLHDDGRHAGIWHHADRKLGEAPG